MSNKNKIVLAYSGGLDTSVILKWLAEKYDAEIIAYVADVGQGEDLDEVREKAIKTGASKVYVENLTEEFVSDFVFPAIKANAIYEGVYLLGTSLARPLIAKRQIEIAQEENAFAVSHGSTGKGNDQVRFELTYYALDPDIQVIAPWREWDLNSRTALLDYAKKNDIPVPVTLEKPYSCDRNLLHISYEGGILEDPWSEPPEDMFEMTVSPESAPDEPRYINIDFEKGVPIKVDGKELKPSQLLDTLNKIGGSNGVGRVDLVENRFVGMKSRGVYETPGGTILHVAHRALESLTMDREVMHLRDSLIPKISELIYYGFWYSPEMDMLRAAVEESQKNVSGGVRLKIYKGNIIIAGRRSPYSLYQEDLATFEEDSIYNQADATGFIKLNALRLSVQKLVDKKG
ncbi:MAG: argininosuccinate synthase [Deltaproteobacteria bacterium]|nr:argininosuccinate synthase [Deltaproteobacteria bacterium]MCK5710727.1 argininosuccinate synthase [Deltaproteobacteria bacterium]